VMYGKEAPGLYQTIERKVLDRKTDFSF